MKQTHAFLPHEPALVQQAAVEYTYDIVSLHENTSQTHQPPSLHMYAATLVPQPARVVLVRKLVPKCNFTRNRG